MMSGDENDTEKIFSKEIKITYEEMRKNYDKFLVMAFFGFELVIIGAIIALTAFLIINLPYFIMNDPNLFLDISHKIVILTILFNLSNIFYFSSMILNLLTFFQVDESTIDLEVPSCMSSKKGKFPIGRALKGKFRRQRFSLSLKDLEKHMFICGATDTGKSSFLQNFLINFTK